MRLRDMNWMDVERYLQRDNRIIIVVGGTDQHGYLSLSTSTLVVEKIATAAAEQENVLLAPPLYFGVSAQLSTFPGTISLGEETFAAVLSEIIDALVHQGFLRFFIVNGNDSNKLPRRIQDMQMEGLLKVDWYDWWDGPAASEFETKYGLRIDRGNWGFNFPFTRVRDVPQTVKPPVNLDYLAEGQTLRDVLGDGSYGGPYQIEDKRIFELFDVVVAEAAERVRSLKE